MQSTLQSYKKTNPSSALNAKRPAPTNFEKFNAKYPGGLKSVPVKSIPSPVPGGGPAVAGLAKNAVSGVKNLLSSVGQAKRVAQTQKKLSDLKRLETEIAKVRKPSGPLKMRNNRLSGSLAQRREAAKKPSLAQRALDKADDAIDSVTSGLGFGVGPVARAKATAVTAGVGNASYTAADRFLNPSGWARGGLVKRKTKR
jgi:hypothetical protein